MGTNKTESTDNLLYQILGKKAQKKGKNLQTTRYVDDAKSIGIFFISLMIILIIITLNIITSNDHTNISTILKVFSIGSLFLSLYYIYYLGQELIRSKYRSRAIRIYTNYLEEEN